MSIFLTLIVEDKLSAVVAKKMLKETNRNYEVSSFFPWDKDEIKNKIKRLNQSAKGGVFFVLTDQDTKDRCPPKAINELPASVHPNLLYRFAVMEIESWILAHRQAISKFLSVPLDKIPLDPDSIEKPKEDLIKLAKKSRSSSIRKSIVPREASTSKIGPDYNRTLSQFVIEKWNVNIASRSSPSLKRAFNRLKSFTPQKISLL